MARAVRLPFPVPRESGLDPVGHIRILTGIFASRLFLCGLGAVSCSGLAGPDAGREAPLCRQPCCWKQKHIRSLLTSPFLTSGVRSSFPVAQPHFTTTLHWLHQQACCGMDCGSRWACFTVPCHGLGGLGGVERLAGGQRNRKEKHYA